MTKGQKVRFISGKYGGKSGWLDTSREVGDGTVPVVVDRGRRGDCATHVHDGSLRIIDEAKGATSYAEAVVDQCPDIEKKLTELCRALWLIVVNCGFLWSDSGKQRKMAVGHAGLPNYPKTVICSIYMKLVYFMMQLSAKVRRGPVSPKFGLLWYVTSTCEVFQGTLRCTKPHPLRFLA